MAKFFMQYSESKNTGLSHNFTLSEGAFTLTGGVEKATDSFFFFLSFAGWLRIYWEDFCPNSLVQVWQKPTSYIKQRKVLILGELTNAMRKYLPFLKVAAIDLTNNPNGNDRKEYLLGVKFDYLLEPEQKIHVISFIQT